MVCVKQTIKAKQTKKKDNYHEFLFSECQTSISATESKSQLLIDNVNAALEVSHLYFQ